MLITWLLACGDGTPTKNDEPSGPSAEAELPRTPEPVEQPVLAEERVGNNGRISFSAEISCALVGDVPLELRQNALPNQSEDLWRSRDSDEPYAHENGAVAIMDLNGDLWEDIVFASAEGAKTYINNGQGGFIETSEWFSKIETQSITGFAAADYDQDGKVDLYVSQFMAPDLLLNNNGEEFKVVSAGLSEAESISGGAAWMDYDRDGDLDLFTAAHGKGPEGDFDGAPTLSPADKNGLYENVDGAFKERTGKLSYGGTEPYTYTGIWLPLDDSPGWDLFLINDFGEFVTPHLGLSNQADFTALKVGLEIPAFGTGGSVADWNQDGKPDILVTGIGEPSLLMSENGTWVDKASEMGLSASKSRTTTWGSAVVDFDNDGDDDIWMTAGPIFFPENDGSFPNAPNQVDGLFLYENGAFSPASWSFAEVRNSRSAVAADFNRDGFWEVVVKPIDGPVEIYWGVCNDSNWLDVRLEDGKGNTAGLGAIVEVKAGDSTWTRWMTSGTGFGSSSPHELHFGLAQTSVVDSIKVTWADGETSTFESIPTKRKVVVSR